MTDMDTQATTATAITAWLTGRVAFYLERDPADIGPDVPFVHLGMDSIYALTLCGDVEDEFGLDVEPTLAWDHPTIAAVAEHLHGRLSR